MALRQRENAQRENRTGRSWGYRIVTLLLALLLVWSAAGCAPATQTEAEDGEESEEKEDSGPKLKYAAEGVTAIDEKTLQESVDNLLEEDEDNLMALYYKNNGYSTDGLNFQCYIGNSPANIRDAFFILCMDPELEDIVYSSDLLRPGDVFQNITLDRKLEEGDYTIYCAQTMVNENQEITNQTVFTVVFHVAYDGKY